MMCPRDYINLHESAHAVLERAQVVFGEAYMLSRAHGPFAQLALSDVALMRAQLDGLMDEIGGLRALLDVAETEAAHRAR